MLSSNSSSCNHNQNPNYGPFSENDITSFTSINSEDPNFFFGFPNSPHMQLEYEDVYLDDFLPHFHTNAAVNMPPDGVTAAAHHQPSAAVRSRSLKKDRHSKINTARGPRDRRMRLSLDVARKFFDLQDLLRYDKASRTVDWLLKNSMSAIRDLERGSSRESCTSEDCGEAVSSASAPAPTKGNNNRKVGKRGVVRVQLQQKRATVAKESRRKARERARERTSQKRRLTAHSQVVSMHAEDLSSDEARISGATTQGGMCDWNSFHFHHTEFLHQDEQIAEFQFNGKPWEGYNSFN